MWLVVLFPNEMVVEVVPTNWFNYNEHTCIWPPSALRPKEIESYVKKCKDPLENWPSFPAKKLGSYGDYDVACRKCRKAMETDSLTSHDEMGKGRRVKTPSKKNLSFTCSQKMRRNDSTSSDSELDDTYAVPKVPSELARAYSPNEPEQEESRKSADEPIRSFKGTPKILSRNMESEQEESRRSGVQPTESYTSTPKLSSARMDEFQRTVLNQLFALHTKLDDLADFVYTHTNINPATSINAESSTIPQDITDLFPLKTDFDMDKIEKFLTENSNRQLMVQYLKSVGGNSPKDIIRRILFKILSNELGQSYNWEGIKKKSFKNLNICSSIKDAVRKNVLTKDATDKEIEQAIKLWLVKCKHRLIMKPEEAEKPDDNKE